MHDTLLKIHVNAYMKKLGELIKDGNVSAKVKFKLMDVVEMRENDWVQAKRRIPQITTIDQVCILLMVGMHLVSSHMKLEKKCVVCSCVDSLTVNLLFHVTDSCRSIS